eukprot:CAMPEP_0204872004 /NCGR_PEP_ID=MMETSP1348-20121228/37054_1 /ASSEMBLY_ACC=CAM_ASM_000700 /TAXON_ID=215587 /ORGANISM="Aplanochytrium stocchinoi, Strain GSBS06" /LENGTH=631 /DNA_ID=CAMNT_0052026625 /DNA_START=370 /DNA_END=2265 /DNA_ORIENTATION=+
MDNVDVDDTDVDDTDVDETDVDDVDVDIDDVDIDVDITALNRLSRPVYVSYDDEYRNSIENHRHSRPPIRVKRDRHKLNADGNENGTETDSPSPRRLYNTLPRKGESVKASTSQEVGFPEMGNKQLPYASPFFLKAEGTESYFRSGNSMNNVCVIKPELGVSSLLTFHGRRGDQKNHRGETKKNLAYVRNRDIVTVYSNIDGGRYLVPAKSKFSGSTLRWTGEFVDVRKGGDEHEFIVHLVGANSELPPDRKSKNASVFMSFRKSGSSARKSSAGSYASEGTERLSRRDRTRKTAGRKRSQPKIVKNYLSSINVDNTDTGNRRSGSRQRSKGKSRSKVSRTHIELGAIVLLESRAKPGYFVKAVKNSNLVHLSKVEPGKFEIVAPELRHLVSLSSTSGKTRMISPKETEREVKILCESEKEWLKLLQKLPMDIVYRILQYQGNWVKTARLVCRQWRSAAELHVRGVRVNGEFDSFHTEERRRNLFSFINRCKYLQSVNFRNVDDIRDDDLKSLRLCLHLKKAMFGGCIGLTDKAVRHITPLKGLTHVNLAMTGVTDAGLFMMAQNLPNLVHINLYGCDQITIRGVLNLVVRLKKLEDLNIRGTSVDFVHPRHLEQGVSVLTGPENPEGIYS